MSRSTLNSIKPINPLGQLENSKTSESLRSTILETAKDFKSSWITLGRYLYTVYQDKLYKEWGFREFETYCLKEVCIKMTTAQKMLRSYGFLEKEEPKFIKDNRYREEEPRRIPDYESVNVLRLAKNRNLDEEDYDELKQKVLEGSPVESVRQQYRNFLEAAKTESPDEIRENNRKSSLKRTVSTLKTLYRELSAHKFLSARKLKDMEILIQELEKELF